MSKELVEVNLKHKTHIVKQLKDFAKNDRYFKLYEGLQPGPNECLVRLFSYTPPKDKRPSGSIIVPKTSTMVAGSNPNEIKDFFIDDIVIPFGIVIKAGKTTDKEAYQYKPGDLVAFPSNKITGMEDNPAYIHWLQAQDVGMATPKGIAPNPKIPTVHLYYANYQFSRLGNLYPDDEDMLTYLLPQFEFRPYKLSA